MGKNISIYLDDEQLAFLRSHKEGPSKIIQKAISMVMKAEKNENGFDEVLYAAAEIRKDCNLTEAINAWHSERDADRW